ncbi:hypothetical protein ACEQ8H_008085 [Pleosporales sp. CAS-2024a]
MQLPSRIAALALLAAPILAQQKSYRYSSIGSVKNFVSRLDLDSTSQKSVSAILEGFHAGNSTGDATQRAGLACDVNRIVFGSKLHAESSLDYGDLVDNNCGGHNPNVGFSSVGSEGVLIDLAKMDKISLATNGTVASIEPGNRWGRVYRTLSLQDKMAVGGRANDIGVGGLLLGGGLSYWSSIHGMACTKVVNYEIVLGNSSITNANATFNSDLWWALKGGGANYAFVDPKPGIVTRFDVETVENDQIWFEALLIDTDQLERFLQVAVDFAAVADTDPGLSATYNLGPGGGAVYLAYNKPIKRPALFKPFYDLSHQVIINSTIGTWEDYHNAVSGLNPFSSLRIAISTYDRDWDEPTLLYDYALYLAVSADVQSRLNATMYFAPQLFSKRAVAQTASRGGSPLGLLPKNHCCKCIYAFQSCLQLSIEALTQAVDLVLEVMITWTDATHDNEALRALQGVGDEMTASAQQRGTNIDFYYMNDAGPNQDVLRFYGSLEKMRSVTSRTRAIAYVSLATAKEVAYATLIVHDAGCKFAIRCAGHNANPGFSSIGANDHGVVLDLRELNSKALDKDANTARVGAGNCWAEVFTWLEGEGMSAIGAREGQVGVSGFLLGGGQGLFSSSHGLGADSVKNFEIVLASGAIVNANRENLPDLYLALKGGGSNFGIVTAVDIEVLPLLKIQYSIEIYDPSDYNNVIRAFTQIQKAMEQDHRIGSFINTRRDFIAIGLFYADCTADFSTVFDPFFKLTSRLYSAVPKSKGTLTTINAILQEWAYKEINKKHAYLTMTTQIDDRMYNEIHLCWKEIVEQLPRTADLHWSVQPLSLAAVTAGKERGGNILGLQDISQSCWIFSCDWTDVQDDEAVKKALNEVLQQAERLAYQKDMFLDLRFPTFAGATQDVLGGFGGKNLKHLQDTADKYDPDGFFANMQSGGFLLHRAR